MIEPREEVPGEFGHPVWKINAFAGLLLCVVGIVMMVSVYLFVFGMIVTGIGIAWAVLACIVGMMQERSETNREHLPHA